MSIEAMKKQLRFLERRLPYAIDITEYYEIKVKMKELRGKIVSTDKKNN
tara:strand:- start:682 stop:828 length:147 start_codon:yes stop_codon:yes gene_type:complete